MCEIEKLRAENLKLRENIKWVLRYLDMVTGECSEYSDEFDDDTRWASIRDENGLQKEDIEFLEEFAKVSAERDRYRAALLVWKRMIADPNYDTCEMFEEFTQIVNAEFGISA